MTEKILLRGKIRSGVFFDGDDVVLTDKRISIGNDSILIKNIEECYVQTGFPMINSGMIIRHKNGRELKVKIKGGFTESVIEVAQRWVNYINRLMIRQNNSPTP